MSENEYFGILAKKIAKGSKKVNKNSYRLVLRTFCT